MTSYEWTDWTGPAKETFTLFTENPKFHEFGPIARTAVTGFKRELTDFKGAVVTTLSTASGFKRELTDFTGPIGSVQSTASGLVLRLAESASGAVSAKSTAGAHIEHTP